MLMPTAPDKLTPLQELYFLIEKAERFAAWNALPEEASKLDGIMADLHKKYVTERDG